MSSNWNIYLIELLLQFLVGVVDTKLFETVDSKSLKPIYIQDSNEPVIKLI